MKIKNDLLILKTNTFIKIKNIAKMKNRGKLITFSFLMLVIAACNNAGNDKLLLGKWNGAEWLIDGKPSNYDVKNTFFNFDSTGHYTFDYSGNNEKGTYKLENEMLFTTPDNEKEIMVKITKQTKDSLVFEMNRSGQPEQLTLIRK